jgi:hypothetical protein
MQQLPKQPKQQQQGHWNKQDTQKYEMQLHRQERQ